MRRGKKKKKKARDVSSFSLIHCLASYLGGLSGQSETVSCRVGRRLGGLQVMCLQPTSVKTFDIID